MVNGSNYRGETTMIELKNDKLTFRFPELHRDAVCNIEFQRTLRIPDDNREYPLPPGLGRFPMEHTEDHPSSLPSGWTEHGGVLLPMYQSEALWINFSGGYPCAIKIATGKINAVTGKSWKDKLKKKPQDYLVVPDQPWLDGYCVQEGLIRQFVAMPLGEGYSAEEQLTGNAEHGGLQLIVYPMKRDRYEAMQRSHSKMMMADAYESFAMVNECCVMGLAPGGLMRQEIYEDEYGFDAWDLDASSRCFVHILNSKQWNSVTSNPVPGSPPSVVEYSEAGLPWFDYYDDRLNTLQGSTKLAGLDSVAAKTVKKGEQPMKDNEAVTPKKINSLGPNTAKVNDGQW
jgi:hypothetical protein